jgi:transposase
VRGRDVFAAFPDDLAIGEGSFDRRGGGDDLVGQRWIEQLVERYNAFGPSALGDLRRGNGAAAKILRPELLERLRVRVSEPPPDGGVWTSGKVARWMAGELGLASLAPQRGWEALRAIGWSIQKPRPRNPKAATPEEQEAFKKNSPKSSPRKRRAIVDDLVPTVHGKLGGDDG